MKNAIDDTNSMHVAGYRPSPSLQRLIRALFYEKAASSAKGASYHTKHAVNANIVRVVLLYANSYLAL
jgi:hypothetical protein